MRIALHSVNTLLTYTVIIVLLIVDFQAALCAMRIIERVPDTSEVFLRPAAQLLNDKKHGNRCMQFYTGVTSSTASFNKGRSKPALQFSYTNNSKWRKILRKNLYLSLILSLSFI